MNKWQVRGVHGEYAVERRGSAYHVEVDEYFELREAAEDRADVLNRAAAIEATIDRCPGCGEPCHATEGNEDGYHPSSVHSSREGWKGKT